MLYHLRLKYFVFFKLFELKKRECVCVCVSMSCMFNVPLKEFLKHSKESRGVLEQASKQAGKQADRQAGKQASRQTSKQASKQ